MTRHHRPPYAARKARRSATQGIAWSVITGIGLLVLAAGLTAALSH